jgi:histidinol-phosphate aminotransferase
VTSSAVPPTTVPPTTVPSATVPSTTGTPAAVIRGLIRGDLRHLRPYGAPQLDVPVQLNTNENPYAPSERLKAAIAEAVAGVAGTLNRYPDRDAVDLRKDLADYLGHALTARQVWAANGSNEIIQQLLQAFGGPGRTALGFEPSYSMHPLISQVTGTEWIEGSRDARYGLSTAAEQVKHHRPDVVFVTSPNNPTGTSVPLALVEEIYDAAPGLVVVDEAYAEFARAGTPSALTLLPGRPRLVVSRTMSKAFAAAGTRLGYLAADPAVVDALLLVRLPYHLSTVTQAVARAALAHREEPLATVEALRQGRDDLVAWLRGHGLTVADSDANFVLFGIFDDRDAVWQGLLDRGVLIRNTGPEGWLRVTVGTPAENDAFKRALWRSQFGGSEDLSDASEDSQQTGPLTEERNL